MTTSQTICGTACKWDINRARPCERCPSASHRGAQQTGGGEAVSLSFVWQRRPGKSPGRYTTLRAPPARSGWRRNVELYWPMWPIEGRGGGLPTQLKVFAAFRQCEQLTGEPLASNKGSSLHWLPARRGSARSPSTRPMKVKWIINVGERRASLDSRACAPSGHFPNAPNGLQAAWPPCRPPPTDDAQQLSACPAILAALGVIITQSLARPQIGNAEPIGHHGLKQMR